MSKKNEAIKLNPNQIIISIKVTADDVYAAILAAEILGR